MGDTAPAKRSQRQRQGAAKTRVFDDHTRKEIKRKRLAALENDNWQEEKQREMMEEDDEDYKMSDDSGDGARLR